MSQNTGSSSKPRLARIFSRFKVHVQGGRSQKYGALQLQVYFIRWCCHYNFLHPSPIYRPKEIWSMEVETQYEKILPFEISLTTPLWMDDPKKIHSKLMTTHGSCFRFGFQKCRFVLPKCKTLSASYHIRLKTRQKLLLSIHSISIVIDSLKIHPFLNPLSNLWAQSVSETSLWVFRSSTPLGSKNAEEKLEKFLLRFSWWPTVWNRWIRKLHTKPTTWRCFFL